MLGRLGRRRRRRRGGHAHGVVDPGGRWAPGGGLLGGGGGGSPGVAGGLLGGGGGCSNAAMGAVFFHGLAVLLPGLGLGLDVGRLGGVVGGLPDRPESPRDLRVVEGGVGVLEGLPLFVREQQEGRRPALRGVGVLPLALPARPVDAPAPGHRHRRRTVERLHLRRVPGLVVVRQQLPLFLLRLRQGVPLLTERPHHVLRRRTGQALVDRLPLVLHERHVRRHRTLRRLRITPHTAPLALRACFRVVSFWNFSRCEKTNERTNDGG
mmetsp:Transcript_14903/g.48636  ORF Transcript_14903/g.48636 Transcript_14903/m.48636 type:complete len:266 (+) Transcript_14903:46-843(+)